MIPKIQTYYELSPFGMIEKLGYIEPTAVRINLALALIFDFDVVTAVLAHELGHLISFNELTADMVGACFVGAWNMLKARIKLELRAQLNWLFVVCAPFYLLLYLIGRKIYSKNPTVNELESIFYYELRRLQYLYNFFKLPQL